MTAPELKQCPFCGEKCRVQQNGWTSSKKPSWWEVACDKCDFVHAGAYTETEAIAAWNTRADTATWNAAIRAAADAATYVIQNIDILKPDGETYETPRVQKVARGLVDVARQDILALLKDEK